MKRNTIFILTIILAVTGAISYIIIWYRNKKAGAGSVNNSSTVSDSKTGYPLPAIQSYGWWINSVGHAKFPLGLNSKGVEVVKVQEVLNDLAKSKSLPTISVDGIWGPITDARFKLLFPQYSNGLTQTNFAMYFDANNDISILK